MHIWDGCGVPLRTSGSDDNEYLLYHINLLVSSLAYLYIWKFYSRILPAMIYGGKEL